MAIIEGRSPAPGETGVATNTNIEFDIVSYDGYTIAIDAYVSSVLAYDGYSFLSPFASSTVNFAPGASLEGYDAYQFVLDRDTNYQPNEQIVVSINGTFVFNSVPIWGINMFWGGPSGFLWGEPFDSYGNISDSWGFRTEGLPTNTINTIYFSDGYGLKAIEIENLAGESQSQVRTVLTSSTIPALSSNNIQFIHGNRVDGYDYLALSFEVGAKVGVDIIKQESEVNTYMDGYDGYKAHLTQDGTLYAVNADLNQVEVYYGANFRPGSGRTPDYVYNTSSTPPLFGGAILDLHVVDGFSSVLSGGTRFYVGTTLGATRVDTYDKSTVDGYSDGYDGYGISTTYSIVGGGADYEAIGGTVATCTNVSSDDENLIMLVGTDDGAENGGLTQISLSGNRKILFMNKETGFIPSNTINDVFGKAY